MAPTCQPISGAAILQPERIESQGPLCSAETGQLTFVNHTGLTDTVDITYTASPVVTVLEKVTSRWIIGFSARTVTV